MSNEDLVTRESLLLNLRDPGNDDAWDEFYYFYRGLIFGYARSRGCTETMAQDVLQETLVTLTEVLPDFRYDPARGHFRSLLWRIVSNHVADAFRRERKYVALHAAMSEPEIDRLLRANATADTDNPPRQAWDEQWNRQVLATALERVRKRVEPRTFDSFRMYVLEQRPVQEVCDALDLTPNVIYQQRHRLLASLQAETEKLRHQFGDLG